ncbi:hypothetical protein KP509_06G079900 [Ceratopteris richardii]|uniref:Uncharacterized protein n=1 Tax=Ceratopteris richardii TaxID=49495 RepID=A0A8T2UHW9_CERRI|nr:hypothetical protein KP509_06G079900 [Ceratopteris richardii]
MREDLVSSLNEDFLTREASTFLLTRLIWVIVFCRFPYFLLGLGLIICLISFIGHIAAETSIGCCLSSYMFFLVILLLLQGAFVAEVLLNENWEEIIPDDPSGLFDSIKEFVEANADFCKWTGIAVVIIEVVGLLLAFCIKAASPRSLSYDSDDEYILPRTRLQQPLLVPRPTTDCSIPAATGTVEGWPVSR